MTATTAFEAAVHCHRGGQLVEAERLYRQVPAQDPNYANASFLLGVIALRSGQIAAAIDLFRRAIDVDPHNAAYHANLGECLRRLGQAADAMDAFLRALMLRPDLAEPLFNRHQDVTWLRPPLGEEFTIPGDVPLYKRAGVLPLETTTSEPPLLPRRWALCRAWRGGGRSLVGLRRNERSREPSQGR
jgi:tetratricopeptide (TPR) repeat protein